MIFTHSDIDKFLQCRRLWAWNYVRDFQPPEVRHGPRALGHRVHRTLANSYAGSPVEPVAYFNALSAKDMAWQEENAQPEWAMDELYKDTISGRKMIEAYFEWLEDTGADAGLTVEAVETPSEALILDGDVLLKGIVDTKFRREDSGLLVLNDFKTVGRWTSAEAARLERSYQHHVYMSIENLTHPDDPVGEAVYTVLKKGRFPTIERFKVPGTGKSGPNRLKDIERICAEMIRAIDEESFYPSPGQHCGWCDYRHPCSLADDDPATALEYLEVKFTVGTKHARY